MLLHTAHGASVPGQAATVPDGGRAGPCRAEPAWRVTTKKIGYPFYIIELLDPSHVVDMISVSPRVDVVVAARGDCAGRGEKREGKEGREKK